MSKDLEKRMDIIFLKSLLIENTAEALPKMIESKKEFILFLTSLNETIQEEPAFFLIADEIIKRAESVIQEHRFQYKDEETINLINDTIINLNNINGLDEQTKQINYNLYLADQEIKRNDYIPNSEVLVVMIINDAKLLESMFVGNAEEWIPRYYIGSTNYLINTIPEVYEDSGNVKEQTIMNMEIIRKNRKNINFITRASAKKTIKTLKKIKKKEE